MKGKNEKKYDSKKIEKLFCLVIKRHKNELISWSCFFASFFLLFVAVSVFLITQESGVLKTVSCGNAFKIAVISVSLLVVLSFLSLCAGFFFQRKFKRAPSMIKFFVPGWGWYRIFLSPSGISLAEVEDEEIKRLAGEKGVKRVPARKKVGIPKFLVFQFNKFFVSSDVELNAIVRVKLRICFVNTPFPLLVYSWCGGSLTKFRGNLREIVEKGRFLSSFDNFFDKDVKQNLNGGEMKNLDVISVQRAIKGTIKRTLLVLKERIEKTGGISCSFFAVGAEEKKEEVKIRFRIAGMYLEELNFLRRF